MLVVESQLIEAQASDKFDPTAYKEEVRERIEAAVQKKVEGQEITLAEETRRRRRPGLDLMEALRASLEKRGAAPAKAAAAGEETRKPPKRAEAAPGAAKASKKARE